MKTGNTAHRRRHALIVDAASMEPGHEDREYERRTVNSTASLGASMEPGHEDREYFCYPAREVHHRCASMEPGHEDREYAVLNSSTQQKGFRLNGARS